MIHSRRFVFSLINLLWVAFASFLLTACDSNPVKPKQKQSVIIPTTHQPKQSAEQTLQNAIKNAKNHQAWAKFIEKSQQLWQMANAQNQMAIEYMVYATLKQLPASTLNTLSTQAQAEHNIDMEDWIELVQAMKRPSILQKTALKDLQTFNETALYQHHLLPQMLQYPIEAPSVHQIGILLPLTGQYSAVAQQIKAGILKHYYAHLRSAQAKPLILKFYNTAQLNQVVPAYQQAISEGADQIIGPLQKSSISLLAEHKAHNLLVLNQVNNIPFRQFPYRPANEAEQIVSQLQTHQFKHIGILTNDLKGNTTLATQIDQLWEQQKPQTTEQMPNSEPYQSSLKIFPSKHPKLRKALGEVLNETLSQARKNNLHWLLAEKLTFTPRVRHDLDALVMIGSARSIAVFKPQLKFYDLKLPLFASAKISPTHYIHQKPNPDLKQVIFPTFNAVLHPSGIHTAFEAFGWDSLTPLLHPDWFAENLCYNDGKRGRLSQAGRTIQTHLIWAHYNQKGNIEAYPPPPKTQPNAF